MLIETLIVLWQAADGIHGIIGAIRKALEAAQIVTLLSATHFELSLI